MKGYCIAFGALLAFAYIQLPAQDKTPTIVFEGQSKDFGKVIEGEKLKHIFKFTNRGQAPLEILKVEGS